MKRVKRGGLSTQPCGTPVIGIMVDDVRFPILTFWGLFVRKSLIHEHSKMPIQVCRNGVLDPFKTLLLLQS